MNRPSSRCRTPKLLGNSVVRSNSPPRPPLASRRSMAGKEFGLRSMGARQIQPPARGYLSQSPTEQLVMLQRARRRAVFRGDFAAAPLKPSHAIGNSPSASCLPRRHRRGPIEAPGRLAQILQTRRGLPRRHSRGPIEASWPCPWLPWRPGVFRGDIAAAPLKHGRGGRGPSGCRGASSAATSPRPHSSLLAHVPAGIKP